MPDDVIQIAFEALDKGLSKKIDDIGGKLDQLEGKVDTSAESFRSWDNVLDKSFDHVGTSAADVSKKLESLGAATTDAAKVQHELEKAQNDVIASAQKLAEAQQALARNTDPSKHAELKREVSAAQVSLDSAATSVKKYSDEINRMGETTAKTQSGFSKLQAGIVTANQALELVQRGFGYVKTVVDETIGSTLEYAKQVRDLSTNLGITAEETSKIIQASDDYGISVESVTGALQMAVKRGFAPNIETLARLADEYNNISDPTQRAARLAEVFGRNWTALTPILKEGGQAIREAADEAAKLGLVLNDKDVQAARNLEVQVDNLNDRWEALKIKMGKDLIPDAINVVETFNQFADVLQGTVDPLDDMNRRIGYATTSFGENSDEVAALRAEYERLKNAIKDVAMTAGERLIRSNIGQAKSFQENFAVIKSGASSLGILGEAFDRARSRAAAANDAFADGSARLGDLKTAISGAVGNELKQFNSRQDELKIKAQELQSVISTSYGKIRDDAIASLADVNKELDSNAAAHEDATRRILFGYAEQQLAIGGLTNLEIDALDALAIKWDLKSKEDVAALKGIRDAAAGLASDQSIQNFVDKSTNALAKAGGIKITPEIDYKKLRDQAAEPIFANIKIEIPVKPKIDPGDTSKLAHDLLGDIKYAPPILTPKVDTKQAEKDLNNYVSITDKTPKEKKTNFVADITTATKSTQSLLTLFGLTPAKKSTQFEVKADEAIQTYDNLYIAQERLHDKIIDIIVRYKTEGEPPTGLQHGGSYIVPPRSDGGAGDYFPILAAPGERVTVQTKAQQNAAPAPVQGGDTFIYNTNVFNPLAAAMLADKQRRDRLARSNARMGVT